MGGLLLAISLPVIWEDPRALYPAILAGIYLLAVGLGAGIKTRNFRASLLAPAALLVQFTGYGLGFLKSTILLTFSRKKAEDLFPRLFFKP